MLCISNPQLDLEVLIVRTQYATGNFYKNVADNIEAALRDRKVFIFLSNRNVLYIQ